MLLSNVSGNRWDFPLSDFVLLFYIVAALCGNTYKCSKKRSGCMFNEIVVHIFYIRWLWTKMKKLILNALKTLRVLLCNHVNTSWPSPPPLIHSLNIIWEIWRLSSFILPVNTSIHSWTERLHSLRVPCIYCHGCSITREMGTF